MGRTQPLEMVGVSMVPDPTYPEWKDSETPATWLGLCRVEVFGPSSCPSKDPRGLLEAGNWSLAVIWGLQGERCGGCRGSAVGEVALSALSLAPLSRLWNSSSDLAPDWPRKKLGEN